MLTGPPGIGKTTLWEAGIAAGRESGLTVLAVRAEDAEAQLSFVTLTDLLEGVDVGALAGVPEPQARALGVALLRAEPGAAPVDARAIATGFLNVLRSLSRTAPVLVAIDDVPWIDPASAEVIAFAARRLSAADVCLLLSARTETDARLLRALGDRAERLPIGPVSLGAIRRILFEHLSLSVPRRLVRRIFDYSLGNPLLALELGRPLAAEGRREADDLPIPGIVEDLLGVRVDALSERARRLLLALALSPGLRRSQLAALAGAEAVDEAEQAGVVTIEGDHARPGHPLFAGVVRVRSSPQERRDLHRALADVVVGEELRARHLLLSEEGVHPGAAAAVAAGAAEARARGAVEVAVELAERALQLTARDSEDRCERLLALAGHLIAAGELGRAAELLGSELELMPTGNLRARAHVLLFDSGASTLEEAIGHLEDALAHSDEEPAIRAMVLARMAECVSLVEVARLDQAEGWLTDAMREARRAGPDLEAVVLHEQAWLRILRGRAIGDLLERHRSLGVVEQEIHYSVDRVAGIRSMWRGEMAAARSSFTRLLDEADRRGEGVSFALMRLQLCELELRAARWDAAEAILEEWEHAQLVGPSFERCHALLAAGRGLHDEATCWADEAIARAEERGIRWEILEALRARGMAALARRDPVAAAEDLGRVWDHTVEEGVEDPGAFPVAPDLVEALALLGERDRAAGIRDRLRGLAADQDHPWASAAAARCAAILTGAPDALRDAAAALGDLGLPFDRARTLLALGRIHRKSRRWGAAREALQAAVDAFEQLGSPGWAECARAEFARVGGRRARGAGELSPAEEQVAGLAAQGLTNREIARELVVTVRTVETHLSSAYAKLGLRSRAELVRRMLDRRAPR